MIRGEWERWKDVKLFVLQGTTLQELIRVSKLGCGGGQVPKVVIVIFVYFFAFERTQLSN